MSFVHVQLFKAFFQSPTIFFSEFEWFLEINPSTCTTVSNEEDQEASNEPDENEVREGEGYLMQVSVEINSEPGQYINNAEY